MNSSIQIKRSKSKIKIAAKTKKKISMKWKMRMKKKKRTPKQRSKFSWKSEVPVWNLTLRTIPKKQANLIRSLPGVKETNATTALTNW